nr:hypothetical protein [Myxococcota bacterium]
PQARRVAAVRKPPPPDLPAAALESFVDAVIADKAGDLEGALRAMTSASREVEHPHLVYNVADLHRRMEQLAQALESYRRYLELAPDAPDRAAVTRLVVELVKTRAIAVIDGEDVDAVVFVDGRPVGPSPVVMPLADGTHTIERIGPASYDERDVTAKPLAQLHISAYSSSPKTGNVVMNGSPGLYQLRWKDRGLEFELPGRFTLPPGRHETFLARPGKACTPIAFDVPPAGELVHVWIEAARPKEPKGAKVDKAACIPITVRASRLRFPKPVAAAPPRSPSPASGAR